VSIQFVVQIEPAVPTTQTPNVPAAPTPEQPPDALPQDTTHALDDRDKANRVGNAVVAPAAGEATLGLEGAVGLGLADTATQAAADVGAARLLAAQAESSEIDKASRSLRDNVTVGFDLLQPLSLEAFLSSLAMPAQLQDLDAHAMGSLGRLNARDLRGLAEANKAEETDQFKFTPQQAVQLTGVALTAGTVWWALRAGGLLASLVMGLPAWRHVDVLAVLPDDEDEDNHWSGDQDDEATRDERAVDRVFTAGMPKESEA
jgi:hypothetical protein